MMRSGVMTVALAIGLGQFALAQAPAGAPAGSTGQCNDGSYSMAASKAGACRGHQGVKAWFTPAPAGAMKAAPAVAAAPTAPAPVAKPAAAPAAAAPAPSSMAAAPAPVKPAKPAASTMSMAAPAPGGGAGMVWLNSSTNVYHCQGSRFYGKTKDGKYMTEAAAKAAGAHADHGKACGQ